MPNLTVAAIAPIDYAKEMAMKGTSTDITLYDVKRGEDTVSFIEPTKYPERLAPLFYACSIADSALVVVRRSMPSSVNAFLCWTRSASIMDA